MIDSSIRIRDINSKKLCICYYVNNSEDMNRLDVSLESQLRYTDIKDYAVFIFTTPDLYSSVRNNYKAQLGLTNIIKVSPIFVTRSLLIPHPKVQEYKVVLLYKPGVTVLDRFVYSRLIDYHLKFPLVFLTNGNIAGFSNRFSKLLKDVSQNTLGLGSSEIKGVVFDCYCSRIDRNKKLNDFVASNIISDTKALSMSNRISKSPVFYEYLKSIAFNGIRCSDIVIKLFSDAKGYKLDALSTIGLKLKTILN